METDDSALEKEVIEVLKTIYDPEIPVNIYDLGLIYELSVKKRNLEIKMTLTSPNCSMSDVLIYQVETRLKLIEALKDIHIDLVFEPEWNKDMISEEGQLQLGFL